MRVTKDKRKNTQQHTQGSKVYEVIRLHILPKTKSSHLVGKAEAKKKHTTGGIPSWSPTLVLVARFSAYVWQSGRDAQFSLTYGRMCSYAKLVNNDA
jgi:hypothetical protein